MLNKADVTPRESGGPVALEIVLGVEMAFPIEIAVDGFVRRIRVETDRVVS